MRKIIIAFFALALIATKPCPPDPCPNGCDDKADWIAVGHITKLDHHWQGMPFNHDFATFTFVVDKWLKGGDKLPREIPFQVGWCENRRPIPGDGTGQFKFLGENGGPPWHYLHFEVVTSTPPAPSAPSSAAR